MNLINSQTFSITIDKRPQPSSVSTYQPINMVTK